MFGAYALFKAKQSAFAAMANTCTRGGKTRKLKECGSADNSCCALVIETGLVGHTEYALTPFVRRAAAVACLSKMRHVLERKLAAKVGASGPAEAGYQASEFIYQRDGPQFLGDFVSESKCCRKPGEGFGAIGLNALGEMLGLKVSYRIPFVDANAQQGDDNWWTYEPSWVAPEFVGVDLEACHTGGWHWKFPHEVRVGGCVGRAASAACLT